MERKHFTFSISAEGYMLKYKDQNIGGVSILGKYHGNQRQKQIKAYAEDATREVEDLLAGRGQQRFIQEIQAIDNESHGLIIHSLHDAIASCKCGRWHYSCTGPATRAHVEGEFALHLQ